jgi:hypothetical protein
VPATAPRDWTPYWMGVPIALLVVLGVLMMMSRGGDEPVAQKNVASAVKRPRAKPAKKEGPVETELQSELRGHLDECAFFQENVVMTIPKSFVVRDAASILEANPGLLEAERMTLIEYAPSFSLSQVMRSYGSSQRQNEFINVTLTDRGRSMSGVSETANEYRFELGYRQLLNIVPETEIGNRIKARWYWTVENKELAGLATGTREFNHGPGIGYIGAERTAKGLENIRIWRGAGENEEVLCEW